MNLADELLQHGMPHDSVAERAILAALLLAPEALEHVRGVVGVPDFNSDAHRRIYVAAMQCVENGQPVDFITVGAQLEANGDLDEVGGHPYLVSLTDGLPRVTNLAGHIRVVKEMAARRMVLRYVEAMGKAAINRDDLESLLKSAEDLVACVRGPLEASRPAQKIFVGGFEFMEAAPVTTDWIIQGVIPTGMNGVVAGDPKASKSLSMLDAAVCIAYGVNWMEFDIPRRRRVALSSREDFAGLTASRLRRIMEHRRYLNPAELDEWLFVNTRQQSDTLMLDNPREMAELLANLRHFRPEILILDVFNRLHSANENDAQEMTRIMGHLTRIQQEIGCSVALLHHLNKNDGGTLTKRMRGSSAIAGWYEWCIGIEMVDEINEIREMKFETKLGHVKPIQYTIREDGEDGPLWLARVEYEKAMAATAGPFGRFGR